MLFLPVQASTAAFNVDRLHYFVITTTMIASTLIGIGALSFYVRFRYRGKAGRGNPVQPTASLETLIVGVPLVLFLLWFAIGFRDYVHMTTPPTDAMDVYVMGKQWMWKFAYPEGPNGVNVLHVPAHRPVRLLMTSRDVIHSFYVPAFRVKKDVLPGRYTEAWFEATLPGRYPVLCAEMCGTGHSIMRAEVVVMPPDDFDRWLADQQVGRAQQRDGAKTPAEEQPPEATMVEMGRRLSQTAGCMKCHTINGEAHIGPTWLDMYRRAEPLEDGTTVVADEGYITQSMMDPNLKQVKGFKLVMPSYRGRLTGPESAAIVEYIKTLHTDREKVPAGHGPIYDIHGADPNAVPNPYAETGAPAPAIEPPAATPVGATQAAPKPNLAPPSKPATATPVNPANAKTPGGTQK
jgi:cytochrome c oxidase subunit 2